MAGAAVSASRDGTLAYYTHPPGNSKLVWFDRSGRQQTNVSMPTGTYIDVGLAPNLGRAAVVRQVSPGTTELWIVDLDRGGASRLANAPGQNSRPVFSPDSERVAFSSDRDGPRDMYLISAQGSPPEQPIYRSKTLAKDPLSWSPDGRFLVYRTSAARRVGISGRGRGRGMGVPSRSMQGPATETNGIISPDGQWMTYASDETGRYEVYVAEFPVARRKYRVTTTGGARAWWRADGRRVVDSQHRLDAIARRRRPTGTGVLNRGAAAGRSTSERDRGARRGARLHASPRAPQRWQRRNAIGDGCAELDAALEKR